MSEVNIPLLRKAVEWVEAESVKPAELCEWEQGTWVAWRDGEQPVSDGPFDWHDTTDQFGKAEDCGTCYCVAGFVASQVGPIPSDEDDVPNIAAEALGIATSSGLQRGHLFFANNTADDVRRIAEQIAGERL